MQEYFFRIKVRVSQVAPLSLLCSAKESSRSMTQLFLSHALLPSEVFINFLYGWPDGAAEHLDGTPKTKSHN